MSDFQPIGQYFKKSMVKMALNAVTKSKRKERLMLLYEARIITGGEVTGLIQQHGLKHS
jgi:hypothetical protein